MRGEMPIGKGKKIAALTAVLLIFTAAVYGQYLLEEEEAPEALLAAQLGSADVELFMDGFWEASLFGSLGIAVPKGIPPYSAQFPGMVQGLAFNQEPDLLLSLWVEKRYFFETSILAGYELNSLQMGYINPEEGFLRELVLGVPAPPINSYGDIRFTEGGKNSFGISVGTATEISRHDATLRVEDLSVKSKRYIGSAEVVETSIQQDEYIRGRFFILPDSQIDFLEVFVESGAAETGALAGSDGRHYAPLPNTSYRGSAVNGTVVFNEKVNSRILVYYEKEGVGVGSPGLGTDSLVGMTDGFPDPLAPSVDFSFSADTYLGTQMEDYKIELEDGRETLLLFDPSFFSPFEHCGWYDAGFDLPENRIEIEIELGSSGTPSPGISIDFTTSIFDASEFRVFTPGSISNSPARRYPLAESYPYIYGPNSKNSDNRVTGLILLRVEEETDAYQLENPVAGTVLVRRNGFRETGFTVDNSGIIEFNSQVGPGERIDIVYRTDAGGETSQNLTFGLTSGIDIPGGVFTYAALSGLWNVNPGNYSTRPNQYPGAVTLGAGLDFNRPEAEGGLAASLAAALDISLSVSSPDTSGFYRIFGMESDAAVFPATRFNMYPSVPPSGSSATSHLTIDERGILLFKDYLTYGVSGTTVLNRYDWASLPSEQIFTYADGEPVGPYPVSSAGDTVAGTAAALDYRLKEPGEWVGAQIAIALGENGIDLSAYEGFRFYWKSDRQLETTAVYAQLGRMGEDIDGDNTLDQELSPLDPGIGFDDPVREIQLTVGGRSGRPDFALTTEDLNGNGILDSETALIVSRSTDESEPEITRLDYPETAWKKVEIIFSEEEKRLLRNATAFRVIIESTGGGEKENRLLVTGPTLLGAPFSPDPLSSGSFSAVEKPDSDLELAYPELINNFHPNNEPQRVLRLLWEGIDPAEGWTARGIARGAPIADYKRFVFYLRGDESVATDSLLTLDLTREDETALSVTFPLIADEKWRKYTVDLNTGELTTGGEVIANGVIDPKVPVIDSVVFSCTGSSSGAMYLDEMHFEEAKLEAGYSLQGEFCISSPEPLFSIQGFPIVGNPYLNLDISSAGGVDEQDLSHANALFGAVAGADFAKALSLSVSFDADVGEPTALAGGHKVTIPAVPSPVTFTESFQTNLASEGTGYVHALALSGGVTGIAAASIATGVTSAGDTLNQTWEGAIDLLGKFPVSVSAGVDFSTSKEEYIQTDTLYFEKLKEAITLAAPTSQGVEIERTGSGKVSLDVEGTSFDLTVAPEIAYRAANYPEGLFTSSGALLVTAPFSVAFNPPPGLKVEPYYSMEFKNTSEGYGGIDLSDDLLAMSERLEDRYLLTGPVYDLFTPDLFPIFSSSTTGSVSAGYKPAAGITLSRGYGSYLRDLIIPAMLELEFKRELLRAEDLVTDSLVTSIALRTTAINLFGSRGAYPLFSLYQSDEYTWSTAFTMNSPSTGPNSYETLLQQLLIFTADDETHLTVSNRAGVVWGSTVSWEESLEAVFSWIIPLSGGISLPRINIELEKDVYFTHQESLGFDANGPESGFGLVAGHSTELFFGDYGSLLGVLHIGVDYSNNTWLLGIEGGIRAKVTF